ncbi:MAG: sigma-54-dependent Fis family transcriptional regulator [Myxococcales bacterium]|nr:sigma-54-dependent Fis family transcriptional regulator [Myxococcales bacterium]
MASPSVPVPVSRKTPDFFQPYESSGRPLELPLISRRPFTIAAGEREGVVVSTTGSGTEVQLVGAAGAEAIEGNCRLSEEALEQGAQLVLGRRVVLLVHRRAPRASAPVLNDSMVGASERLDQLRAHIAIAARSRAPVLIRGETGAGKELVARALHDAGERASGPFVAVNLATLTSTLAASELFGHVRGAFSGARRDRDGYFARADGGTLFLDEIGECKPEIQAMLLRTIETGEVHPVGASKPRTVDVRLIAATDAALETMVSSGSFRAPLYYRVASHEIHVPPLHHRKDDVARLLVHFIRLELDALGQRAKLDAQTVERPWLPAALMATLCRYTWPGNVRQLRNIARYLAGSPGPLSVRDARLQALLGSALADHPAPLSRQTDAPKPATAKADDRARRRVSDREFESFLEQLDYRIRPAAEALGVSRPTLAAMIDRHPRLRRARHLTREEIESARANAPSSELWRELRVSEHSLKVRMRQLGMLE